jgi:uncharacterized membrane protein
LYFFEKLWERIELKVDSGKLKIILGAEIF